MITSVSLRDDSRYVTKEVKLSKINLCVGINGAGKSTFINSVMGGSVAAHASSPKEIAKIHCHSSFMPKFTYLTEQLSIEYGVNPSLSNNNKAPFSIIEYHELLGDYNKHLSELFGRKLSLKYNANMTKHPIYNKKINDHQTLLISPLLDGFGINHSTRLISCLMGTKTNVFCVEELASFLHPSIIKKYLKIIFDICIDNDIQLIFTANNPVVISVFFKLFYDENINNEYCINKFEIDNDSKIDITEIHLGNYEHSLHDFFMDFPTEKEIQNIRELSTKYDQFK